DELGRLLPPEALDHFREVAEREQVIGKAQEMRFDSAFIKQRQDLILMMQMVGGEEASLDASRLAIAGKHARPSIDIAPRYGLGQRHDFKPFGGLTRHGAGGGGEYHQPVCGLVSSSYLEPVDQPGDATTIFVL